jgi:Transcription factor/nuclear export subunit protein 2
MLITGWKLNTGEVPSEAAAAADGQLAWPAVAASVRAVLPAAVWDIIPVELYTTFWSLSLYDIHVPIDS